MSAAGASRRSVFSFSERTYCSLVKNVTGAPSNEVTFRGPGDRCRFVPGEIVQEVCEGPVVDGPRRHVSILHHEFQPIFQQPLQWSHVEIDESNIVTDLVVKTCRGRRDQWTEWFCRKSRRLLG